MAARRRSEASGSPSGRARAERMASLSSSSGKPHATAMSIRPGRRSAGSMSSGREEAASTNTAPRASTPSRWQRRVLTTRSVTPVESQPRARPSASNSSKKRRHGAAALAFANVSRTFASDAPMYLSSSSGPETLMKGRPLSAATALASNVLPQPGGPCSSAPDRSRRGAAAKEAGWRSGSSTACVSASLAAAMPPTPRKPGSAPSPGRGSGSGRLVHSRTAQRTKSLTRSPAGGATPRRAARVRGRRRDVGSYISLPALMRTSSASSLAHTQSSLPFAGLV
mmetsp:Transcript_39231/g.126616  ORF Transcript_39231/g.126616 Transcript_39231/m.126616 type:complete len:282 (+) Transcript_39231:95-940(+)